MTASRFKDANRVHTDTTGKGDNGYTYGAYACQDGTTGAGISDGDAQRMLTGTRHGPVTPSDDSLRLASTRAGGPIPTRQWTDAVCAAKPGFIRCLAPYTAFMPQAFVELNIDFPWDIVDGRQTIYRNAAFVKGVLETFRRANQAGHLTTTSQDIYLNRMVPLGEAALARDFDTYSWKASGGEDYYAQQRSPANDWVEQQLNDLTALAHRILSGVARAGKDKEFAMWQLAKANMPYNAATAFVNLHWHKYQGGKYN